VLRLLINPMVTWAVTHDQHDMLTPDVVQSLVTDVFHSPPSGGEVAISNDVPARPCA
jgi:hypothetical protein